MTTFLQNQTQSIFRRYQYEEKNPHGRRHFQVKKLLEPTQVHHTVSTFCEAVRKDIEQNQNKTKTSQNLIKGERKALEDLRKRDDIIITNVDKGGAVVILDVENYIKEAHRQLNDEQ